MSTEYTSTKNIKHTMGLKMQLHRIEPLISKPWEMAMSHYVMLQ